MPRTRATQHLSPEACTAADLLQKLIFTNPFLPEREQLNREIQAIAKSMGIQADADGPDTFSDNPNSRSFTRLSSTLIEAIDASRRDSKTPWTEAMLERREHLAYVLLFHRHMASIDRHIRQSMEDPLNNPRWNDFRLLERDYRSLFETQATQARAPAYDAATLTAFFAQIRRAFFLSWRTLAGDAPVLRQLRARVWQSTFTHNMKRYLAQLHPYMGEINTLITGPSGSGKEVIARCIGLSRLIPFDPATASFERNFVETFHGINLSALSSTLIESELFGHRKGAFTGALEHREGYFASCGACGTVFLDEIGDTDPAIQVKLLRVLQTRQFQRMGDTATLPFKGKVLAATHVDLIEAMQRQRFREDLFYRLNADLIQTPSLSRVLEERSDELPKLILHIARKFAGETAGETLAQETMDWTRKHLSPDYPWPGNFRELEQCVRNVMVHGEYHPPVLHRPQAARNNEAALAFANGTFDLDALCRAYIRQEYQRCPQLKALAVKLGADPRTLRKYLLDKSG
jgi:DNA-binding NtrC family response regulator